jgi:hypothetical protein
VIIVAALLVGFALTYIWAGQRFDRDASSKIRDHG